MGVRFDVEYDNEISYIPCKVGGTCRCGTAWVLPCCKSAEEASCNSLAGFASFICRNNSLYICFVFFMFLLLFSGNYDVLKIALDLYEMLEN